MVYEHNLSNIFLGFKEKKVIILFFIQLFLILFLKVQVQFSDNKIIFEGLTDVIPQVIDTFKKAIECYDYIELEVDSKICKHIIGKNGTNGEL